MGKLDRIYRRTDSGQKAWKERDPSLSEAHLQILGVLEGELHWDEIRKLFRRHADYQRLAELEREGLVANELATAGADLDFTGSFAFSQAA
jgi:hypothetical protein